MIHPEPHPLAGKTVRIKAGTSDRAQRSVEGGAEYRVEDWWDRIAGKSWGECNGNPACLQYAMRLALTDTPPDDEVLYGKIGPFGHLVHASEIEDAL